jgi:hypothetical protein
MAFWNRKTKKLEEKVQNLESALKDFKLAARTNAQAQEARFTKLISNRRKSLSKPLHYSTGNTGTSTGRKDINYIYEGPSYDLAEIGRAQDVEPYINQSIRKHREQILKEGWELVGKNEEAVAYVKQRLFEMSLVSGVPTEEVIREYTTNLVTYATAFIVLKRSKSNSTGKRIRKHGKELEPIAGMFPMDPTSVQVALNEKGHPVSWKQEIPNPVNNKKTEVTFKPEDIVVATIDRKSGFVFGTPYILPTLDDVRTLRRLEEISEVVSIKHAHPHIHWKVGTDEEPAQVLDDGTTEVELVKNQVEDVSSEGGIVTSSRVQSEVLNSEAGMLPLDKYLEYFEARVMGGLRLSPIDLGRGDVSKSSGVSVSKSLQDSARDFQAIIEYTLNFYLINNLLLEGGFDLNPDNAVSFKFPVIDREEERAKQQHGQDLFLAGTVSCREFRREFLNKEDLSDEDRQDTKPELDHKKAKELQQMANAAAAAKAAQSSSSSSTSIKNKTANKVRPTNQSGQKSSKTRVTSNNSLVDYHSTYETIIYEHIDSLQESVVDFVKRHKTGTALRGDSLDITTKQSELQSIFDAFITLALKDTRTLLDTVMHSGLETFCDHADKAEELTIIPKRLKDRIVKNLVEKSLKNLSKTCRKTINTDEDINSESGNLIKLHAHFDQLKSEMSIKTKKHIDILYRFGYSRGAKAHDKNVIALSPVEGEACEKCMEDGNIIVDLRNKDLPATSLLDTHSNCTFDVSLGN